MTLKHKDLLKLHGKKISCKITGVCIDDAIISVDYTYEDSVYICHNDERFKGQFADCKFGYKYSWRISCNHTHYEYNNRDCTDILLNTSMLLIGEM